MNYTEVISQIARTAHRPNDPDLLQMAGLAEGTNANTLKITATIVYFINNVQCSKAVTDNVAMTACAQQAAETFCYYLVSINAAGTVTVTKGTNDTYALPTTPTGSVPIGAFKVVTAAATTFTSGTDDLSKAGLTVTFYDIDTGIIGNLVNQTMRQLERGIVVNLNGAPIRVTNWDHMRVRTQPTLASSTASFSITGRYKEVIEACLISSENYRYPAMTKSDTIPLGLTTTTGRPTQIARIPSVETVPDSPDVAPTSTFYVYPISDASYTVDLLAYQYSPDLDGVIYQTNWWTQNAPEILVKGTLVELSSYLLHDERQPLWKTEFQEAVASLASSQKNEKLPGRLSISFTDPLSAYTGMTIEEG